MSAAVWDKLHRDPRHRLEYPSEHVVRWLAGLERPVGLEHALDIGCGGGRHLKVLLDYGYRPHGIDASHHAHWGACAASMVALPARDDAFSVALSYGTFYYGTPDEHRQAVHEMHRVLRPGGKAFVCIRTGGDWRRQFTHGGVFRHPGEPEDGMPMHFVTEYEVRTWYGAFSELGLELTETTRNGRTRCDSDWLISLTK